MTKLNHILNSRYWGYFILVARVLLALTFIKYGYSKLTDGQFGITPAEELRPIKDLHPFRVAWYLFDHQPFKAFIGIFEILCGLLLMINRTVILGAFLFLPIVTTILIIDISFMPQGMANAFTWRLSYYIFLDLLILLYYRDNVLAIWKAAWNKERSRFKFPIWSYFLLPILAFVIDIISPRFIFNFLNDPLGMLKGINELLDLLISNI